MRIIVISLYVTFVVLVLSDVYANKGNEVEVITEKTDDGNNCFIETAVYEIGINNKGKAYFIYKCSRKYKVERIIYKISKEGQQWMVWLLNELFQRDVDVTQIEEWEI